MPQMTFHEYLVVQIAAAVAGTSDFNPPNAIADRAIAVADAIVDRLEDLATE